MPPRTDAVVRRAAALVLALAATAASPAAASTGGSGPAQSSASHPVRYRVPMSRGERRTLDAIARCESGMNPHAVSRPRGLYRGLYQFDLPTWRAMGGTGDPAHSPVWMQDLLALKLLRAEGLRPWPTCGAAFRAYRSYHRARAARR